MLSLSTDLVLSGWKNAMPVSGFGVQNLKRLRVLADLVLRVWFWKC